MLTVRPSSCITTRAIVSNNRQTASVSERDKVSAAARLTLMILVTKRAITAVQVAPNLTVGHAHWNLKRVQLVGTLFVAIEGLAPLRMLASRRRHTELFLSADVNTLCGASSLRDPGRVDMAHSHGFSNVLRLI